MNTENAERLSTSPGPCPEKDSNTKLPGTLASPTPTATLHDQSSRYLTYKPPSSIALTISGSWYMEFMCMFLCFVLFGLYCWFLSFLNGKPEYELGSFTVIKRIFPNLGSLLSQVSVIFRLLMFVPVSSAMGQLSWYRFWNTASRPVSDLQVFDAATRGLSGSVRLLLSRHLLNSFHTTLGSLLTIAALYLGSSMQNAVGFGGWEPLPIPAEYQENFTASIPFLNNFDHRIPKDMNTTNTSPDEYADPRMERSLYSALVHSMTPKAYDVPKVSNISSSVPVVCTSSACGWDSYTTLAVQSRCQSAPALIEADRDGRSDQVNISTFVHAPMYNNTSALVQSKLKFQTSSSFPGSSNLKDEFPNPTVVIIHLAAISVDKLQKPEAVECILYWEVQHFREVEYNSTSPSFNNVETKLIKPKEGQSGNQTEIVFEAPCNDQEKKDACLYRVKRSANLELQRPVAEFFNGYVVSDSTNHTRFKASGKSTELLAESFFAGPSPGSLKPLASFLGNYMSYVADDITNNILSTVQEKSIGTPKYMGNRYQIRWYNVIYSGTMMVISAYIFLFAAWKTRRMPVWKTSLLPFLYHGLQHQAHEEGCDYSHLAWMEQASRHRRVTLRDEHDGLGLRLRDIRRDVVV